jgi:hypothetical protein
VSDSYAIYRDVVAQGIRNDATISGLVNDEIHTSGLTTITNAWLTNTNRCCIVVSHQNRNSSGLGGVAIHGISTHDHLFRITVIQIADNDTYAADVSERIKTLLEKGLTVTMNNLIYQIDFTPPFKNFLVIDPTYPDRVNVVLDCRTQYLG